VKAALFCACALVLVLVGAALDALGFRRAANRLWDAVQELADAG